MMNGSSSMDIGWIFGWLFLAIVLGMIIRGICVVPKRSNPKSNVNEAIDILKKRYAKGEITDEEFEHMKQELES